MIASNRRHRRLVTLVGIAWLLLANPAIAGAHSELVSSVPPDGATVPSPLIKPIVLEFSAPLAEGSKAELFAAEHRDADTGEMVSPLIATGTVDGPGGTITFPRPNLGSGEFRLEWTSISTDGDVLRGIIEFTVAAPGTSTGPGPSSSPMGGPTASAAPTVEATPSEAAATPSPEPASPTTAPSSTPTDTGSASGQGDVILPIVVALVVVGAGAAYFLSRRGRPAS